MAKKLSLNKYDTIKFYFKILIILWFVIFLSVFFYYSYKINSLIQDEMDANNIVLDTYISNSRELSNADYQYLKSFTYKQLLESEIDSWIRKIKYRYNILITILLIINLVIGIIAFALYRYMRKVYNDLKIERHLSGIDELTHVFNRRKFNEIFVELWERAKKEKHNIALMLVDLDYFKEFNDNYGHSAGDIILRDIGEILEKEVSKFGGYVFRYGGDEFVVLLPNLNITQGGEVGNNILKAIRHVRLEHSCSPIEEFQTVSIGVTSAVPKDEINIEEFFNHADTALYLSKRYGRNRVSVWNI